MRFLSCILMIGAAGALHAGAFFENSTGDQGSFGIDAQAVAVVGELKIERVSEEYNRYVSPDYRFSLLFPAMWELAEDTDDASLAAISPRDGEYDHFRENVLMGSFELDESTSLLDYYTGNLNYLKERIPSLEVHSSNYIKIDGREAIRLVYTSTLQGTDYKTMQVFLLDAGRGYILTCMAEARSFSVYANVFNHIIESVNLEE